MTRVDLDIQVRVAPAKFAAARDALARNYEDYRPDIWTEGFAALVSPDALVPTGLVMTAVGAEHDLLFIATWDRLRREPELIESLNALKSTYEGSPDAEGYEEGKAAFFAQL